jgi:hypothetical protein
MLLPCTLSDRIGLFQQTANHELPYAPADDTHYLACGPFRPDTPSWIHNDAKALLLTPDELPDQSDKKIGKDTVTKVMAWFQACLQCSVSTVHFHVSCNGGVNRSALLVMMLLCQSGRKIELFNPPTVKQTMNNQYFRDIVEAMRKTRSVYKSIETTVVPPRHETRSSRKRDNTERTDATPSYDATLS